MVNPPNNQKFKTLEGLQNGIQHNYKFAKDRGEHLYIYDPTEGGYKFDGKEQLERLVTGHLTTKDFRKSKIAEVVKRTTVISPYLMERPPLDRINLRNGIYNLESGELEPHTHEYLSLVQLPIKYNPGATCPAWEKFCSEVLPEDEPELAWELCAWLMLPIMSIHKAVILLSNIGANGKSLFLHGIQSFLGNDNTEANSLHALVANRFRAANLIGKLANICTDIPNHKLEDLSIFKMLTGGDAEITIERKGEQAFKTRNLFARLIFSANEMPASGDSSGGFIRRFKIVPFSKEFAQDPKIDEYLKEALSRPTELSGVFNRALAVLPRILTHGLTESRSGEKEFIKYARRVNSLARVLENILEESPEGFVLKRRVLEICNERGCDVSEQALGYAMKRYYPDVERDVRRARNRDGRQFRVFQGVRLIGEARGMELEGDDADAETDTA